MLELNCSSWDSKCSTSKGCKEDKKGNTSSNCENYFFNLCLITGWYILGHLTYIPKMLKILFSGTYWCGHFCFCLRDWKNLSIIQVVHNTKCARKSTQQVSAVRCSFSQVKMASVMLIFNTIMGCCLVKGTSKEERSHWHGKLSLRTSLFLSCLFSYCLLSKNSGHETKWVGFQMLCVESELLSRWLLKFWSFLLQLLNALTFLLYTWFPPMTTVLT